LVFRIRLPVVILTGIFCSVAIRMMIVRDFRNFRAASTADIQRVVAMASTPR
jgi:hypothetical protein